MHYLRLSKGKRKPTGKELLKNAQMQEQEKLITQTLSNTIIPIASGNKQNASSSSIIFVD